MVPEMHSANDTALPLVVRLNEFFEDGKLAQPSDYARSHSSQSCLTANILSTPTRSGARLPAFQSISSQLFKRGLQTRSDIEYNLGRDIGTISP
jgi:hypothetical protein